MHGSVLVFPRQGLQAGHEPAVPGRRTPSVTGKKKRHNRGEEFTRTQWML